MNRVILAFIFSVFLGNQGVGQSPVITFYGRAQSISAVNSPYDENYLALHPNGDQLIITRRNHPDNIGEIYNPGDMWIAEKDTSWSVPKATLNIHPD